MVFWVARCFAAAVWTQSGRAGKETARSSLDLGLAAVKPRSGPLKQDLAKSPSPSPAEGCPPVHELQWVWPVVRVAAGCEWLGDGPKLLVRGRKNCPR